MTPGRWSSWSVPLLVLAAGAILVARHPAAPTAETLQEHLSLSHLSRTAQAQAIQILTIPLAAMCVVFTRLTLGLQMLGPFRPILIAIALQVTGIWIGGLLLLLAMLTVMTLRPRLKRHDVPYFGRLSVLLAAVSLLVVGILILTDLRGLEPLERVAFFPIVVLMLTADGFARVLARDGMRPALWRGAVTLAVALAINTVLGIPGLRATLLRYPELGLLELGAIVLVGTRLRLQLLRSWNPPSSRAGEQEFFETG